MQRAVACPQDWDNAYPRAAFGAQFSWCPIESGSTQYEDDDRTEGCNDPGSDQSSLSVSTEPTLDRSWWRER